MVECAGRQAARRSRLVLKPNWQHHLEVTGLFARAIFETDAEKLHTRSLQVDDVHLDRHFTSSCPGDFARTQLKEWTATGRSLQFELDSEPASRLGIGSLFGSIAQLG